MPDKKMLKTVEDFKKELKLAKETFHTKGRDLERRANSRILHVSDMGFAYDIVHQGAEITSELYASCEMIVREVDRICRPLLDKEPDSAAIKAVADLITEVVETITGTETNFTVKFEGEKLGDAAMQPVASVEAQMIQKFWESTYRRSPGFAKEEKKKAEEKAKKEKAKKAEADSIEETIRKQEALNRKLNGQVAAQKTRYMSKVGDFEARVNKRIDEETNRRKQEIEAEKNAFEKRLAEAQAELSELGFFKFRKKKELREEIEVLEYRLSQMVASDYGMESVNLLKRKAEKAVSDYRARVTALCNSFTSVETKTVRIPRTKELKSTQNCSYREKVVLNAMWDGVKYTVSELAEEIDDLPEFSNQRISSTMMSLRTNGFVEREEIRGKMLFTLAGGPRDVTYEIVTLNEKNLEQPCPEPPDLETVMKA